MSSAALVPITESDLGDLAAFLERSMREAGYGGPRGQTRDAVLERLRWRVLRSPARTGDVPFGECVRSAEGEIVGSLVYTPVAFRLGDEHLLGCNSGYFFTAPSARGWGLVLLRRFTKLGGAQIRYSSSLNDASGGLWRRLGGSTPPGADTELLFPLHWGPILEEAALRRRGAARFAPTRLLGALRDVGARYSARGTRAARLQPCRDWDELAELAELHRPRDAVVAEHSVAFLRWRFEQCPGPERIDIQRFEDEGGRRGWVALIATRRGERERVRTRTVLTLVRPREGFDPAALLRALADRYAGESDLLALGAAAVWPDPTLQGVMVNKMAESPICMIGSDSAGRPYAERALVSLADGDSVE